MKYVPILGSLLLLGFLSLTVSAQANLSGFTGLWTLDRERTNLGRDFPETLKDFKMLVSTDQDRLIVKSQIVGNVELRTKNQGNGGGGISSGSRTSAASPNGVMATSGDNASASNGQASYGGTLAIYFTPGEITYDLTGKELSVEPAPGNRVNGTTRIRAKVGKDGKSLELTVIRKMKGSQGESEITTRENWKLSEDGKTLQFHRTVQTPSARDNIEMTFAKQG